MRSLSAFLVVCVVMLSSARLVARQSHRRIGRGVGDRHQRTWTDAGRRDDHQRRFCCPMLFADPVP